MAILLLGGNGERYDKRFPKQFASFDGEPLFLAAAKVLREEVPSLLYVVRKEDEGYVRSLLAERGLWREEDHLVYGGATRQESVRNAVSSLEGIDPETILIIQDAARPWIKREYVENCYRLAKERGAAVTAYPSSDSVFLSEDGKEISSYLDRTKIYQAQTPQAFSYRLLAEAERKATGIFTDEGSLVEATLLIQPAIVLGSADNRKITTKEDWEESL